MKTLNKIAEDIIFQRSKILEDFSRAYLAANCKTEDEIIEMIGKIELVVEQEPMGCRYYFIKKNIINENIRTNQSKNGLV